MSSFVQVELFPSVEVDGRRAALKELCTKQKSCTDCKLNKTRTNVVFGEGSPKPLVAFVGEGPGESEDLQGRPFIGRAGDVLTAMITAMGMTREGVYICNVVGCRPPGNRRPEPDEISSCSSYLAKQLQLVSPSVIVTLGATASQALLNTEEKIGSLRGRWHAWEGIPVRATFHPAYLLRNPPKKRDSWEDMKFVLGRLALINSSAQPG
jgi:DNA polymerase